MPIVFSIYRRTQTSNWLAYMHSRLDRAPVIVGVGEINDRPAAGDTGPDSAELMAAALRNADQNAGNGGIAKAAALFVVPQLSFDMDIPAALAKHTGIAISAIHQAPVASGDTPVRLLNGMANAIIYGELQVCAIVCREALRTAVSREPGRPFFRKLCS